MATKGKGRLTQWNDARGFGFITPLSGDDKVFLHANAMVNRQRRPQIGELLSYQLHQDSQGRLQAQQVMSANDRQQLKQRAKRHRKAQQASTISPWLMLFCGAICLASWQRWLPIYTPLWFLLCSCLSFITYAHDKSAAQQHRWRVTESTLQLQALIGGWPGAMIAQRKLRHKSAKKSFQRVFWSCVMLNLAMLFALFHYRALLPHSLY